jgi:hypothetical protein
MLQSPQVHLVPLLSASLAPWQYNYDETATIPPHQTLKGPVWAVWPSSQAYRHHKQQPFLELSATAHCLGRDHFLSYKVTLVTF